MKSGYEGWFDGIDAAFWSPGYDAFYLFRGKYYSRYNKGTLKLKNLHYPLTNNKHWGFPVGWDNEIDAAFYSPANKRAYFFKGN